MTNKARLQLESSHRNHYDGTTGTSSVGGESSQQANHPALADTMKTYGLTDDSSHLIELSAKQGPPVHSKPLENLTDRQLADTVRMVLRSDIMLETICCAARDRIIKLSREVDELRDQISELRCRIAGEAP